MYFYRDHHIVALNLESILPSSDPSFSILPTEDEVRFECAVSGFPNHVISYFVQDVSRRTGFGSAASDWSKPSALSVPGVDDKDLDPVESSSRAAIFLHRLLDELPSTLGGQTLLTIVWTTRSAWPAEDHIELFGAVKRAVEWFDAKAILNVEDGALDAQTAPWLVPWIHALGALVLPAKEFLPAKLFDPRRIWSGVVGRSGARVKLFLSEIPESSFSGRVHSKKRAARLSSSPSGESDARCHRLCLGHGFAVKKIVLARNLPLHRLDSTSFALTVDFCASSDNDEDRDDDDDDLFNLLSSSPDLAAILFLDFIIDAAAPPSCKQNGAGRRHWDKLAASTRNESGEITAAEFVFPRPCPDRTFESAKDKRRATFVAFPTKDPRTLRLCRMKTELELNAAVFETNSGISTKTIKPSVAVLSALSDLPVLEDASVLEETILSFTSDKLAFEDSLGRLSKSFDGKFQDRRGTVDGLSPFAEETDDAEEFLKIWRVAGDACHAGESMDAGDSTFVTEAPDDPFSVRVSAEEILHKYGDRWRSNSVRPERKPSFDGLAVATLPWPEVKEIQWHDVYYNRGSESEEKAQEIHMLKTRCQPVETMATTSKRFVAVNAVNAGTGLFTASKASRTGTGLIVDHFDLFCVGKGRKRKGPTTPTKISRGGPAGLGSSLQRTPRKTPKKDVLSPAARKLVIRAKGRLSSPVKGPRRRRSPSKDGTRAASTSGISMDRLSRKSLPSSSAAASEAFRNVAASTELASSDTGVKETRSERNKRKLKEVCVAVLKEAGVARQDPVFAECFKRLYAVSKSFVKDLKSSQNLREEMRKIAKCHVELVVAFERKRM